MKWFLLGVITSFTLQIHFWLLGYLFTKGKLKAQEQPNPVQEQKS